EDVEKIVETYKNRETLDKYSYAASLEEIAENDYNLNIPRYVDTFEEEEPIDLEKVQKDLNQIDDEIVEVEQEIDGYLKELGVVTHD
ncbi:MAG: N-6 DNA methylase, partial [Senegalia sp. (in: firmicutes)]